MSTNTTTNLNTRHPRAHYRRFAILALALGAIAMAHSAAAGSHKEKDMENMPGMDMGHGKEMHDMGPSMEAMSGHMQMTAWRTQQPGDEERARAVIAAAKSTMDKYQDYRKALADGFVIAHPKVDQLEYHFSNEAWKNEAESHFDPTKPSSLLYYHTPHQMYKLEGVMYTAKLHETEDELNRRIPLSIAQWHQHTNFCAAPANRAYQYFGAHPMFGMFGSINTKPACEAQGGVFYDYMFTWMIHVFPYEKDFKSIFSMNDDVPHVAIRR